MDNKELYKKIKYPIHKLKKGESALDLLDLATVKEHFAQTEREQIEGLDPEFVIRYIILMNSPGSPAFMHDHIGKRKTWVLKELGIEPDANGRYEDGVNNMVLKKIPEINRKIVVFNTLQRPADWSILMHSQETLFELLNPEDKEDGQGYSAEETKKRFEVIETVRKAYNSALERLNEHNADLIQQNSIELFAAQSFLGIRHEEVLAKMPPMPNPKNQKANSIHPEIDEN